MKNCAIIQIESIHEIVTPGIIHSLNSIGYKPILFFNKGCSERRGNIFEYCDNLDFELVEFKLREGYSIQKLKEDMHESKCEFVVVNTLQKNDRLHSYEELDLPLIGIVHNVNIFLQSEIGLQFTERPNTFLLTIASHVSLFLRSKLSFDKTNIDYYVPSYLINDKDLTKKQFSPSSTTTLAIAGGVNNIRNRGFSELLNFLRSSEVDYNVKFLICGGGIDRVRLEKFVERYELQNYFDFVEVDETTGYVMYDKYYNALSNADFLLTLFPPKDIKYFKYKATASIMTAISIGLPIITDIAARTIYGVPCLAYENDKMETLFKCISDVNEESYHTLQERTINYRDENRLRSITTFEQAINSFTV